MRSWRTTASGLIGALALVVVGNPSLIPARFHWVVVLAGIVASGGFAALGITGKDAAVHSSVAEVAAASPENVSSVSVSSQMKTEVIAAASAPIPTGETKAS